MLPSARWTSASTVGLPRESRISLPTIRTIVVKIIFSLCVLRVLLRVSASPRQNEVSTYNRNPTLCDIVAVRPIHVRIEPDRAGVGHLRPGVDNGAANPAV